MARSARANETVSGQTSAHNSCTDIVLWHLDYSNRTQIISAHTQTHTHTDTHTRCVKVQRTTTEKRSTTTVRQRVSTATAAECLVAIRCPWTKLRPPANQRESNGQLLHPATPLSASPPRYNGRRLCVRWCHLVLFNFPPPHPLQGQMLRSSFMADVARSFTCRCVRHIDP